MSMLTPANNFDALYKVVIVGDSGVGKSNIILRFTQDKFNKESKSTIGVEFGERNIEFEGKTLKGQLWDTAGQERFRAISSAYYRGAQGAVIVYDITNRDSFESVDKWIREVKAQGESDCIFIIIGNKADLQHMRQVETVEGKEFAQKRSMAFFETSAASGAQVIESMSHIITEVHKQKMKAAAAEPSSVKPQTNTPDPNKIKLDHKKQEDFGSGAGGSSGSADKKGCC